MFAPKAAETDGVSQSLLPPERSYCVAHSVWKGKHRGFELNAAVSGRTCEIDVYRLPYVRLNVGVVSLKGVSLKDRDRVLQEAQDMARLILRDGYSLTWFVCSECGVAQVKHPRQSRCMSVTHGGCGQILGVCREEVRRYRVADGYARQDEGCTWILFEEGESRAPKNPAEFKAGLGVAAECHTETDELKFQKYYKRFLAPVMASVSGKVTSWWPDGNGFNAVVSKVVGTTVETMAISVHTPKIEGMFTRLVLSPVERADLDARGGKYRFDEVTGECVFSSSLFYDGAWRIQEVFASFVMGRKVVDGEGLQGTIVEPRKTFKGLGEVYKNLKVDLVLYLGKNQLVTIGDALKLQIMVELHPSNKQNTDLQMVTACGMAEVLPELAAGALLNYKACLNDSDKVSSELDVIMKSMNMDDMEWATGKGWSLIKAYRAGMPVNQLPWCRRRLRAFFKNRVREMITRFRVPLQSWAVGGYFAADRSAVDDMGMIRPELATLKYGTIVIPAAPFEGMTVTVRRPVEVINSQSFNEQVLGHGMLAVTKKCPFIYWSLASMAIAAIVHGGMDLDDLQQVIQHQAEVERRFASFVAMAYPIRPVLGDESVVGTVSSAFARYEERLAKDRFMRLLAVARWDPSDGLKRLVTSVMAQDALMSIGRVSLDLILDNENLNNGRSTQFALARVAPNLETVIDSSVHVSKSGATTVGLLVDDIKAFEKGITCVEACLGHCVPYSRRGDVEVYEGKLSAARAEMIRMEKRFNKDLDEEGSDYVRAAYPDRLEMVSSFGPGADLLESMETYWDESRAAAEVWIRADLLLQYKDEYKDLKDPVVLESFNSLLSMRSFQAAEEAVFVRFDGVPDLVQAVAVGLKRAYCGGLGSDQMFSGNHTVGWFIQVWTAFGNVVLCHDRGAVPV